MGIMAAFAFTGICAVLAIIGFVSYFYGYHDERLKAQSRAEVRGAPRALLRELGPSLG